MSIISRSVWHNALVAILVVGLILPCWFVYYVYYSCCCWKRNREKDKDRRHLGNTNNNPLLVATNGFWIIVLVVAIWIAYEYNPSSHDGLHELVQGTDSSLQLLLDKCPLLQRGPRPLITNPHLQFVPWMIQNYLHSLDGLDYERFEFNVTDCLDKSVPNCAIDDRMTDTITLDVFPPFSYTTTTSTTTKATTTTTNWNRSSPVILIAPGLRCNSQDLPSNSIIRILYGKGFRSIVVHRRGHTPNWKLRAPRWNLFGDVDDLEQVYYYIKDELLPSNNVPMFLHGISSGTATVVSTLSKWDKRRRSSNRSSPSFVAAVVLTPGYDISAALRPERFKWPYNPILTSFVKDFFLKQNEAILKAFNETAYESAMAATTLHDVVEASSPFAGYRSVESYYEHVNPINDMDFIATPIYVINALDDPCCSIDNLYDASLQHQNRTYKELIQKGPYGLVAVTKAGSHCPFLDRSPVLVTDPLSGGRMLNSWADQSIAEYFVAALEIYGEERRFL